MKKIILLVLVGIISIAIGLTLFYYDSSLDAVGGDDNFVFTIESGQAAKSVIDTLYDQKIIKDNYTSYIYYKLNNYGGFQAGNYMINRNMDVKELFDKFSKGDIVQEIVQITFLEGKRVPRFVSLISQGFGFTEEEIYDKISDVSYLKKLIDKYWFLTEDILDSGIYYPLEGYLYPDTYVFSKYATIEEVIEKILDNTSLKLNPYKDEFLNNKTYSVHELFTMASIIEMEGKNKEDREKISQVIYSRLKDKWALGMDVTSYYGVKKEMTDVIYQSDLDNKNPYNTRLNDGSMDGKLPIGAICNPGLESLVAAIRPSDTKYYWFVANVCTGEVFFQKNALEFTKKVNELRTICELN